MPQELNSALVASQRAITFDKQANINAAIYYYKEAVKYLSIAINNNCGSEEDIIKWKNTLDQYKARIEALDKLG